MKKYLFGTHSESLIQEVPLTVLRVFTGLSMAIAHGYKKMPPGDQLIEGVSALGFPMPVFFAWAAGLSEFAGGILIALGLLTRPSALFLGITMAVAGFLVHGSDPFNIRELSMLYLAICLVFAVRGSNRFSVDAFIRRFL